ncbi:SRPBCC family protein [Kitasatospora nipponensis]|uniref:SRPBCC family protein n=1 Tax=Kitasatospora nipponensis TaxID=258049 RepID=A0ABP4H1K7_9ACTN
MIRIEESVEVDVPVAAAYAQWSRFEEFPRFMPGVLSVQRTAPHLTHWVVRLAGATREFDATVTELVPQERIAWCSLSEEVRQAGVVTFHRLSEGRTRVMLQLDSSPLGVLETVGGALGFVHRQSLEDLRGFKDFVESSPGDAAPGN